MSGAVRRTLGRVARPIRALGLVSRAAVLRVAGVPRDRVRVFYGHARIPAASEPTSGGIVKFQRMQDRFPNTPWRFNTLYMVSSRLPHAPVGLARMAAGAGARFVWNQNGVASPAWPGPAWKEVNAPLEQLMRAADYVFYQSEFCRRSADRFLAPREGPWEILPNAVDTTVFTPRPTALPEPLTILVGGTQDLRYRVSTALETLALVARTRADARMVITGRLRWTPDETECGRVARQLADEHGVAGRVTFLGPYTQAAAPDVFRGTHLLLHPKYNDPCPGTVVEALACGLPVVFSHSGGVPELVGPDAGIGVPAEETWERVLPPDPVLLADAVLRVADDLGRFSLAARRRAVERFDLGPWLERHHAVFEGLLR